MHGCEIEPVTTAKPTICFVAQRAYNVLARSTGMKHIGGAETQQVLLARGLVELGHRVSFVVHDHGQEDGQLIDGIHVYKSYRPEAGVRGLRFLHPRLMRLWAAMRAANADVYYQRGAETETGLVANWCRRHRRKFVFAVAGHHMLLPNPPTNPPWREKALFRYGMSNANLILVQTQQQQSLLDECYSLDSTVHRNCSPPQFEMKHPATPNRNERSGVLWVGRLDKIKRLEWCLEAARSTPEQTFTVVGTANRPSSYASSLIRQASELSNVSMVDYVPPTHMEHYYGRAAVLLCTSVSEGFPNTFLEAWCCGTPVVTTVDPDGLVGTHTLGRVAHTRNDLRGALTALTTDSALWDACSCNCARYVEKHHNLDTIVLQLSHQLCLLPAGSRDQHCRALPECSAHA